MKAFTDYPFIEFGDSVAEKAPIRMCDVLSFDGDKYCLIRINGKIKTVKSGYLYKKYGRYGEVETINTEEIK